MQKLTDSQLQSFIVNGYLTLRTDLPRSFHEAIYRKTQELTAKEGNLGNNILPRVPELQAVFEDPTVRGAFSSILGDTYVMHSHRHPHQNRPHSDGQGFHKDSYWGHQKVRHHCPRWAMAFYYPQDSPLEMGPSSVLPRTQYYNTRITENNTGELPLSGEAGTLTIIHFDLWHRAMANRTDKTRYMMKFQFIRMDAPETPSWNVTDPIWNPEPADPSFPTHHGTWRHVWKWMGGDANGHAAESTNGGLAAYTETLGDANPSRRAHAADAIGRLGEPAAEATPDLIEALNDPSEPVRLNAAYTLGTIGEPAVPALIVKLSDPDAAARRMAAYALAAVGEPAVSALTEALQHAEDAVRIEATYALAQIGPAAAPAIPALMERTKDEATEVRRYLPEALGGFGAAAAPAVPGLTDMLDSDTDEQARFEAALALAQIGPAAAPAIPVLTTSLRDGNRYVRDNAVLALKRIGTPEAETALFDYLLMARWCALTSPESTF